MMQGATFSASSRVRQGKRIAARQYGEQAVVVALDVQQVLSLNEVATFLWNHADGRTAEELWTVLSDTYEVDLEEAESDVRQLLSELSSFGVLEIETP